MSNYSDPHLDDISSALNRLNSWIEAERYAGWDPYDAMNSALLRKLSPGRNLGMAWTQLVKRSPLNLRPILGVRKGLNPKGMGLFMSSAVRRYLLHGEAQDSNVVVYLYRWLLDNYSKDYRGYCWGYNFDWSNRSFSAPAATPTVVNTSFIAQAFLDVHLYHQGLPDLNLAGYDEPLAVARSACEFVLNDLNLVHSSPEEMCFSYTPLDKRCVHNANVLGALLLANVFEQTNELPLKESALRAARFTAQRQRKDGSWPYGEANNDQWVDNYHTGFVLVALKKIGELLDTREFVDCIQQGYWYWKRQLFVDRIVPKYYSHKTYPIDVHSAAQAILTALEFRQIDPDAQDWAVQLARWSIRELQDKTGYFYHQLLPGYTIRIPYIRWSQAWMQRALTELLFQICRPAKNPAASWNLRETSR
jgi:hypothetical protein